jgi:hypothetical protein
MERSLLLRTWAAVAAIVVIGALVVAFALTRSDAGSVRPEPAREQATTRIADFGPPSVSHDPIVVNGVVCGQCR